MAWIFLPQLMCKNISIAPGQEIPFTYNYAEIQEQVGILVAGGAEIGDAISGVIGSPTVMKITAPTDPTCLGEPITANASFTNPDVADIHTATWDWGDGEVETQNINTTGGLVTMSASHTYGNPGVYTIAVTVTDDDGNSDSSEYQYIVVSGHKIAEFKQVFASHIRFKVFLLQQQSYRRIALHYPRSMRHLGK